MSSHGREPPPQRADPAPGGPPVLSLARSHGGTVANLRAARAGRAHRYDAHRGTQLPAARLQRRRHASREGTGAARPRHARREITMPIPQVTDRIKEAPARPCGGFRQHRPVADGRRQDPGSRCRSRPRRLRPASSGQPRTAAARAGGRGQQRRGPPRACHPRQAGAGPGGAKAGAATKPGARPSPRRDQDRALPPGCPPPGQRSLPRGRGRCRSQPGAETKPAAKTKPGAYTPTKSGRSRTDPAEPAKPARSRRQDRRRDHRPRCCRPQDQTARSREARRRTRHSSRASRREDLAPIPSYDDLSVASLRARLRGSMPARSRRCSTTRRRTRAGTT